MISDSIELYEVIWYNKSDKNSIELAVQFKVYYHEPKKGFVYYNELKF